MLIRGQHQLDDGEFVITEFVIRKNMLYFCVFFSIVNFEAL